MNGEIIKLLEMCKNGTLTVEATEELLDAIYRGEEEVAAEAAALPWDDDDRIHIVAYLGHKMLSENTDEHNGLVMIRYDGDPKDVICTCGDFSCGIVRGDVTARDVSIGGDVNGSVTASGKVTVSGVVKGHVNGRYSAEGAKVSVKSDDLKNLGSSISEMVKHSLDFATDAINSASDRIKKEYSKAEAATEPVVAVKYENVTDMPDDGALRIAVIRGNTVIRSSEMVDTFTVDLGDYEANDVYCSGSLVCGNVNGDVTASSVTCDEVTGDITASESVTCDDVGGDITAGGSVTCDAVEGDVTAGGNV